MRKQYRLKRRPIVMTAIQWDGEDIRGIPEFLAGCRLGQCSLKKEGNHPRLNIDSDYGVFVANPGDYICRSMQGGVVILTEGQLMAEWEKEEEGSGD